MQFESWSAAFEMGGHGVYIWPVYLLAVLVICVLLAGPAWRTRSVKIQQRSRLRREAARREREGSHAPGA